MSNTSNPSAIHIKKIINEHGPIPFAKFMQEALYAPGFGYYVAGKNKLGKYGDFYTAPEISPLFGAALATDIDKYLAQHPGSSILELGPGTGKLAASIICSLQQKDNLDNYYMLEVSPDLQQQQKETLQQTIKDNYRKIQHITSLPENFSGIIIANEVADAMPVTRFTIHNDDILEQYVEIKENVLSPFDIQTQNDDLINQVNQLGVKLANGYSSEINLALPSWISSLSSTLQQGLILVIDYGYTRHEYYHPERMGGTLKCFSQQQVHDNPFINVGQQDISAHVDFSTIAQAATQAKLEILGFCEQAHFLMNLGILDLAEEHYKKDPLATATAVKLLTMPSQMGSVCKVIALGKNIEATFLSGFCRYNKVDSLFSHGEA